MAASAFEEAAFSSLASSLSYSPSTSYDVASFADQSSRAHEEAIAKIVVAQWTAFSVRRRAERQHQRSLKEKTLSGFLRNRQEGRSLFRLALVHYASLTYEKFLARAFEEWRGHAQAQRKVRRAFLSALASRAIIYLRACFSQWRRWCEAQKGQQLLRAFQGWEAEAKASARREVEREGALKAKRRRAAFLRWRERAQERRGLREKARAVEARLQGRLCRSALGAWRDKARARGEGEIAALRQGLALAAWRRRARAKVELRRRMAGLEAAWRQKRRARAFSAWKGAWEAAKDWQAQKRQATAHYVQSVARALLREWRKVCEVIAWSQMREAQKARSNAHKALVEWRELAFRANDLERRRRLMVGQRYAARLRGCFEVLQLHREAAEANVAAVAEVYALVARQSVLKILRAWRNEFVPARRRKRSLEEAAARFARRRSQSAALRAWVGVNGLGALERRAREAVAARKCKGAFQLWRRAHLGLRAREREQEERGARLAAVLWGHRSGRLLRAWKEYTQRKSARELAVAMAAEKRARKVVQRCLREAWVPYVKYCRLKQAKRASAEALRACHLAKAGVAGLQDYALFSRQKKAAAQVAAAHHLGHRLRAALARWSLWLAECKRRRRDESEALRAFWKRNALAGIQKMMETGLWRHRLRMHTVAEANAEATRRSVEVVEPVARIWRQKARRSLAAKRRRQPLSSGPGAEASHPGAAAAGVAMASFPTQSAAEGAMALGDAPRADHSAQAALERFSVLLDCERSDNNILTEFIMKKSKDRRQPRILAAT